MMFVATLQTTASWDYDACHETLEIAVQELSAASQVPNGAVLKLSFTHLAWS